MFKKSDSRSGENEPPNSLPAIEFQGRVYFRSDFEGCAMICDEIIRRIDKSTESIVPIGFDIEWPVIYGPETTTLTSKTALVQLCVSPRTCHLFHIYYLDKLPAAFVLLLSHPKVRLVGVNVKQDVRKLGRDFREFPAQRIVSDNCVDCGTLANELFAVKERWSLARLTSYLLKKHLDKSSVVRRSQWHRLPLSPAQKAYAATDAYASLSTYLHLQSGLSSQLRNTR